MFVSFETYPIVNSRGHAMAGGCMHDWGVHVWWGPVCVHACMSKYTPKGDVEGIWPGGCLGPHPGASRGGSGLRVTRSTPGGKLRGCLSGGVGPVGCLSRGVFPKGVSAKRGCLPSGCLPRLCLPRGLSAQGNVSQGECLLRGGVCAEGGVCPWEGVFWGGVCIGGSLGRYPPADGYCCRWYSSYLNAFLLSVDLFTGLFNI